RYLHFSFSLLPPHPTSTLFPYTTLFRSHLEGVAVLGRREPARSDGADHSAEDRILPGKMHEDRLVHAGQLMRARRASLTSGRTGDRKSTRLNSSHLGISYAVFCLKKKKR